MKLCVNNILTSRQTEHKYQRKLFMRKYKMFASWKRQRRGKHIVIKTFLYIRLHFYNRKYHTKLTYTGT